MSLLFRFFCYFALCLVLWSPRAMATPLVERLDRFPDWQNLPPIESAQGDLIYPDWMEGTWEVTSTLVDLVAPLAPDLVTPGFEGNRPYLDRPVTFPVRFSPQLPSGKVQRFLPIPISVKGNQQPIVADREFNGSSIARAYLGDRGVVSVKVDPDDPNRQVSAFRGDRQLVSIVTGRLRETPGVDRFAATELIDQVFRTTSGIYFNRVETTTAYQRQNSDAIAAHESEADATETDETDRVTADRVTADQVTAIYLSPQDPDYFKAQDRPVALYRYRLDLVKQ